MLAPGNAMLMAATQLVPFVVRKHGAGWFTSAPWTAVDDLCSISGQTEPSSRSYFTAAVRILKDRSGDELNISNGQI